MMQLKKLAVGLLALCSTTLPSQTVAPMSGTFSNLAASKQSGDINGYEIVVIPQGGSSWIVFQCSEGAPSSPVLVPTKEDGISFSFTIQDKDNACKGSYVATRTTAGLTLRGAADGEAQILTRRQSYWTTPKSALTPYERTTKPFFKALRVSCADKNLEDLAPGDLNYQIELFQPKLNVKQNNEFLAEAKIRCKNSIAGTGCGNVAFLDVAERRSFLSAFVGELCQSRLKCSAFGECSAK